MFWGEYLRIRALTKYGERFSQRPLIRIAFLDVSFMQTLRGLDGEALPMEGTDDCQRHSRSQSDTSWCQQHWHPNRDSRTALQPSLRISEMRNNAATGFGQDFSQTAFATRRSKRRKPGSRRERIPLHRPSVRRSQ